MIDYRCSWKCDKSTAWLAPTSVLREAIFLFGGHLMKYFVNFEVEVPSNFLLQVWGTRWHSCLRNCARSRKVAGFIPDGVIGNFYSHSLYGRTMILASTRPLTVTSTRNISWG